MRRLLVLAVGLLLARTGQAAITRLAIAPGSSLRLDGKSNIAHWQCRGTTMSGSMEVDAPIDKINEVIDRVEDGNISVWMSDPSAGRFPQPRFGLSIPIDSLRCSGGRPMEHDMRDAMKAERHPLIEFQFTGVAGEIEHDLDAHLYRTAITGSLSLAGTSREIELSVVAERLTHRRFRLRSRLPVRMSDFGIEPPTALFGLIHADDALAVEFDLVLEVTNE
jgi:hypothetical protein